MTLDERPDYSTSDSRRLRLLAAFALVALACVGYFFLLRSQTRALLQPSAKPPVRRLETLTQIAEKVAKPSTPPRPPAAALPSPQASASAAAVYSKDRFLDIVEQDRLCEYLMLDEPPFADQVSALLNLRPAKLGADDDRTLRLLYEGPAAPLLGQAGVGERSTVLDFFNALLLSNLLQGVSRSSPDVQADNRAAFELFDSLQHDEPDNAAHPYFQAAVLKHLGEQDDRIRESFAASFTQPRFESYYGQVAARLADKGFNNVTAMLVSLSVVSRIPVPNFGAESDILGPMIESGDAAFVEGAAHLGQLLMEAGERNKENSVGPFGALEYAVGRGYYLRAWKKLHPGEAEPAITPYSEWWNKDHLGSGLMDGGFYGLIPKDFQQCDRREIDGAFEGLKQNYLEH